MHGDIVLRIFGRASSLWIYIDAEYREIASLTRPHPVVCLASELTHRLWKSEYKTYILIVAIGGEVVFVSLVVRLQLCTEGRVLLTYFLLENIFQRVDEMASFVF